MVRKYGFLLLLPMLLLSAGRQLAYTDFWMHAAAGQWIWQHGAVPRENLFMYTAEKYPWIDHTWLSQVVFYLLWKMGEVPAVRLFQFAMLVVSYWILWRFWVRQNNPVGLGLVLFSGAIVLAFPRLSPRPELFSAIGISIFLTHLYEFRQGRRTHLWWLPAYMLVWVNSHGGMLTGLVLMVAVLIGEAISGMRNANAGQNAHELRPQYFWRHALLVLLLTLVATLVNPYGVKYYIALSPARMKMFSYQLTEWWTLPRAWSTFAPWEQGIMIALACLTLLAQLVPWRNLCWTNLLVFAVSCWLLYSARRQVWLFGQTCLLLFAVQMGQLRWNWLTRRPHWVRRSLHLSTGIAWLLLCFTLYRSVRAQGIPLGMGVWWEDPPEGAVRFIEKHNIRGRMYNFMDDGGYLVWRLYPSQKVFIDQLNAHGRDLLEWDDKMVDGREIESVLQHFSFDYIIITNEYFNGELVRELAQRRDWALVFWDGTSCLYLKREPRFAKVIHANEYRRITPYGFVGGNNAAERAEVIVEMSRALREGIPTATLYVTAGQAYRQLGKLDAAKKAFARALGLNPWERRVFVGLAEVALQESKPDIAMTHARRALTFQSRWGFPWKLIGMAYVLRQETGKAIRAFERAVRWSSPNDEAKRLLGLTLFQEGEFERAIPMLRAWVRMRPTDFDTYQALAQAYGETGDYARARDVFHTMTKLRPRSAPSWYGLASMACLLNDDVAGVKALRRALILDPRLRTLAKNDPTLKHLLSSQPLQEVLR